MDNHHFAVRYAQFVISLALLYILCIYTYSNGNTSYWLMIRRLPPTRYKSYVIDSKLSYFLSNFSKTNVILHDWSNGIHYRPIASLALRKLRHAHI